MREDLLGFAASSLSVLLRLAAIDRYGAIDTSTDSSADSAVSLSLCTADGPQDTGAIAAQSVTPK